MSPYSQEMFNIDTFVDVENQILNILFVTAFISIVSQIILVLLELAATVREVALPLCVDLLQQAAAM